MAQETQQIVLSVATGNSGATLKELRENIKAAKQALSEMEIGTEEYQKQLKALNQDQNLLKNAMYGTTSTMEEQTKAAQGLGNSYNALVAKMAELKQEFRATDDATKQMEIAKKINEVNNELKRLDAMQGNFQRNVGNYAGSIKEAFGQAGAVIGGPFATGVGVANNSLKLLSANPVVGVITLLVSIVMKLSDAIKGNEEQTQALNKAFRSFSAIGDLVSKMVTKLADGIVWLAEKFSALIGKIMGANDAMAEHNKLAEESAELTKAQREATIKNAEAEREIAKLRAQAAEKDRLTGEQRLALLQRAADLEKEVSKRAFDNAKREYEIIKAKNALRASSTEELNKEAEAYAAMVNAETAYYRKSKELAAQMTASRRQMVREEREDQKAASDGRKEAIADIQAQIAAEKMLNEVRLSVAKEGTEEYLELQKEKVEFEMRQAISNAEKTILNEQQRAEAVELIRQSSLEKIEALENAHLQAQVDQATADAQAQLAAEKLLNEVRLSVAKEGTDEYLELQKEKAEIEMQQAIANAEKTILNEEDRAEAVELIRQATLEKIEALEDAHLQAQVDQATAEVALHAKTEEQKTKDTKRQVHQRIALGQSYAKAVSSVFGSIADIMEGDSEASEEQLKAAKNMRIAGATIDMLSGVVTAISTAQQLGPIAGPIMAAINSAAVIAAGVANIQKIKQQQTSRSGGSATATATPSVPATVAAPVIATQVQTVRQLTTATEEERLDKMAGDAKVVLVMSDLEAAENDRRVHVEESTF